MCVCLSVCVLGTRASCAKTAELIEMPFMELTRVRPRNHVLNGGGSRSRRERGNFEGRPSDENALEDSAAVYGVYAKVAEPIEMPFGADLYGSKETCSGSGSKSEESIHRREE